MELCRLFVRGRAPATDAPRSRTIRDRENEPGLDYERRHIGGQPGRRFQWNVGPRPFSIHGYRSLRYSVHGARRKLGLLAGVAGRPDSRLLDGHNHRTSRVKGERLISCSDDDRPGSSFPDIGQH